MNRVNMRDCAALVALARVTFSQPSTTTSTEYTISRNHTGDDFPELTNGKPRKNKSDRKRNRRDRWS